MVSYFLQEFSSLYVHLRRFIATPDFGRFKQVVFVDASSTASIEGDLQTWARALGDGHERDAWEDAIRILVDIPDGERWALILDNADDPALDLTPVLPNSPRLTVIITSRNRNLGNLSTTYHMELGEMETEEALATLLHAARRGLPPSLEESESVKTLLRELGCFAVALVQAGRYCHKLSCSFTQYLSLFNSHRAQLMKQAEPHSLDNYQRGAYTTLDLSYKALPRPSREFLHLISSFHHTDIPLTALETAAGAQFRDPVDLLPRSESHKPVLGHLKDLLCIDGSWSRMHIQEIVCNLWSFSLLSITSVDDHTFLQLHPLIQAWLRDMESPLHYQSMACQILTSCCWKGRFLLYQHLLPHMFSILDRFKSQDIDMHVNDLYAMGGILQQVGHYATSARVLEVVLEQAKNITEPDEETITKVSGRLALAYWAGGRWNEAEKLQLEVLEQQRRVLGMEHPDTILAAANLAVIYRYQGHLDEAGKLGLEVLEKQKRILGMEHPDTIQAAANLAVTYANQGHYSEAEKLQLDVLELWTRILGMEHPDTIKAAANLVATYVDQGHFSEAEKLGLEVLEKRKRILGKEHPDTILAAANLAVIYRCQGHFSEAEKQQVEVLEQWKKILGMEHPDTMLAATNLAVTYRNQGHLDEAEKLQLKVLEWQQRILGMDHPDTLKATTNLATTYADKGHFSEAAKLQLGVLERQNRTLGMEHPDTILAAANLAVTYRNQGHLEEAEKLGLEVLEKRKRILGMEHPDTILAAANLAATYADQGHFSEAEKLQLGVLEQWKRILGMEHPDTILAAANLAATYGVQNQWEDSTALLAQAVQLSLKVLGQQHPHTQYCLRSLLFAYETLGRAEAAEETRHLLMS